MDCHGEMGIQAARAELNRSNCKMAPVEAVTQAVETAKTKAGNVAACVVTTLDPVFTSSGQIVERPASIAAPGRARYLLFQVFRI